MQILNAISFFFVSIFINIIEFLPSIDPSVATFIDTNFATVRNLWGLANWLFPMDTLAWVIGIVLFTESSLFMFHGVRYISGFFTGGVTK